MKFVSVSHFIEHSFNYNPSFIIEMDDGIEYISNGTHFLPLNVESLTYLYEEYSCSDEIDELFESPAINISDISCTAFMFCGSDITEFNESLYNTKRSNFMFYNCKNLKLFESIMPFNSNTSFMFHNNSKLVEFTCELPSTKDLVEMFKGCELLKNFNQNVSNAKNIQSMFSHCTGLINFCSHMPKIVNNKYAFLGTPLCS